MSPMAQRAEELWQLKAACRGPHSAIFFPPAQFERKEARAVEEKLKQVSKGMGEVGLGQMSGAASEMAEGIKGRRAVDWRLVDELVPRSRWAEAVKTRAIELAKSKPERTGAGITLRPLAGNLRSDN